MSIKRKYFKDILDRACFELKITKAELATKLGLTAQGLYAVVNGIVDINPKYARKLAKITNVPEDIIMLSAGTLPDSVKDWIVGNPREFYEEFYQ